MVIIMANITLGIKNRKTAYPTTKTYGISPKALSTARQTLERYQPSGQFIVSGFGVHDVFLVPSDVI